MNKAKQNGKKSWVEGLTGFFREVKIEAKRVVWPTRRETLITSGIVLLMVTIAAIFFFIVDFLIRTGIGFILGLSK